MNNETHAALEAAKNRRTEATTSTADKATHAASAAAELDVCKAEVRTVRQERADAVAAAKPSLVIEADAKLLHLEIAAEIAASRVAALTAAHSAAAVELHDASAAVGEAARAVVLDEMTGLAAKFTAAFDAALALGAELQDLATFNSLHTSVSASIPTLPLAVMSALAKLPQVDQLYVPTHILRNGSGSSAWTTRLAELTT